MNSDSVLSGYRDHFTRGERARSKVSAIHVSHRFDATAQRVFDAWLDPKLAGTWLFATASRPMTHVVIDARVGGSFYFVSRRNGETTEHRGKYIEIVPYRRLVFDLITADRPRVTARVTVEIAPRKRGCVLTLRQQNVPAHQVDDTEGRWTGILYGLDETLASRSLESLAK